MRRRPHRPSLLAQCHCGIVSTLNALDDTIAANADNVSAGATNGTSAYVTNRTHLILDTNGYFAP